MADVKITELPELTAVAADDYLEIVDTSTNTNKKISRETLTNHDGVYVPMNNYSGYTGTVVGWSGTPAVQLTYAVIGKLLLMSVYINGISNSTTTSVTIPPGLTSVPQGVPQILPIRVVDNGVNMQTPGMAILEDNGTVIQFYLNYGGADFTATGTKMVSGNFAWIIA